jgi:uncharacterized LabA/DUF88 family protein
MYRHDPSDKIAIFIDGENIHYSAKHMNMRLDYLKMCKALAGGRRLVRAYFYTAITNQSEGKIDFINFLKLNGFRVVTKELKSFTEAETQQRVFRGNLDLDIAIDIYEMLPALDTVVLCSGDGDFVRLVESISRTGTHVEVCALREMTSTDLIAAADEYVDLGEIKDRMALDAPPPERAQDDGPPQSRIRNELDSRLDYNSLEY